MKNAEFCFEGVYLGYKDALAIRKDSDRAHQSIYITGGKAGYNIKAFRSDFLISKKLFV